MCLVPGRLTTSQVWASLIRPEFLMSHELRRCTTLPLSVTSGRNWSQPSRAASLKTSEEEPFLDPESSDDFWLSVIYRKKATKTAKGQFLFFINIYTWKWCWQNVIFNVLSKTLWKVLGLEVILETLLILKKKKKGELASIWFSKATYRIVWLPWSSWTQILAEKKIMGDGERGGQEARCSCTPL